MRPISKLWPFACAFAAGCVVTVMLTSSDPTAVHQTHRTRDSDTDNVRQEAPRAHHHSARTADGPRLEKARPQQNEDSRIPPVTLPRVKEVLPKTNFSGNRKEDRSLALIRKYGLVSNLPDEEGIKALGGLNFSLIAHSYLDNADIVCHRKLRMGRVENGGWEVCDDYEWRPIPPCIVYSFGINYDFSFDDDVGNVYGCDVYSFDPSMVKQPTYQRSERVMFYRYGLGGHSGSPPFNNSRGWILHSLSNFKAMLNHTDKIIDVIKMDVESWEWEALHTMIQERQLHNVRQLLVEYHVKSQSAKFLRPGLKTWAALERLGFRKFYITKNDACARPAPGFPIKRTKCYEVHYVNTKFKRAGDLGQESDVGFLNYDEETKKEILE